MTFLQRIKKWLKRLKFPFETSVFGISFKDEQGALKQSRVGDKLQIVHTPSDKFPKRVLVYSIELNRILGYIDRGVSDDLLFVFGKNFCLDGEIARLYEGSMTACSVYIFASADFMKDELENIRYLHE